MVVQSSDISVSNEISKQNTAVEHCHTAISTTVSFVNAEAAVYADGCLYASRGKFSVANTLRCTQCNCFFFSNKSDCCRAPNKCSV